MMDDYGWHPEFVGQLVRITRSHSDLPILCTTANQDLMFRLNVVDTIYRDDISIVTALVENEHVEILTPRGIRGMINARLLEVV